MMHALCTNNGSHDELLKTKADQLIILSPLQMVSYVSATAARQQYTLLNDSVFYGSRKCHLILKKKWILFPVHPHIHMAFYQCFVEDIICIFTSERVASLFLEMLILSNSGLTPATSNQQQSNFDLLALAAERQMAICSRNKIVFWTVFFGLFFET